MKKITLSLILVSLSSFATENLQTINELTDKLCNYRVDKKQCEEMINTITSLSMYSGYAAGICGKASGSYTQLDLDCKKAQEEMANIMKRANQK
ncbi:hypothetical protein AB7309_08005 [Providencia manganoxydans]|uniref:hypothetical protein n=1 Tax=Providencia manganoxydans TaxID=2923283 RepID=UPI0034E4F395